MKRYDPAYLRLLGALPGDAAGLRHIAAVTHDPDMARPPFFRPGEIVAADDVPVAVLTQRGASATASSRPRSGRPIPRPCARTTSRTCRP